MASIDISTYSTLNTYSVLAASEITTVNTTAITNGFSYGSSPTATYTGNFVGNRDSANAGTAQGELTTLITDINNYIGNIPGGQQSIPPAVGTTITLSPNINYYQSAITFASGTNIVLDAGNDVDAQFFITSNSAITFTGVASITLTNGASTCNVFWLANTEAITFSDPSPPLIPGIFIAGTAITFASTSGIAGRLYAKSAISFTGTSSVHGTCTDNPIVCYAKGTLILTKRGFIPIEHIKAGYKVITKGKILNDNTIKKNSNFKIEPVMWVSKFKVDELNSKSRPICIEKGALSENSPFKDLYVSPEHRLLLNGKMVSAKSLVNETTIYQDNECDSVEYYHLECEHHSAIFANGVLAESYLEVNNRGIFENAGRLRRKVNCA